jgi:ATP-binding cassette subfamily F protein 3
MRMLSGEEAPDAGTRTLGHQVVMEYFAQDEATRLDPVLTVYETLASGSPNDMVPAIRNILGGFLFTGDDVYKKAGVLSGGERTRLAVARMLLRPSNTLLLDEPTNHLDLDSKDVLLDALEDYGGTLIIVSHDRYFVEKLATKIIEIGHGEAVVYPGTYTEFLWHKEHPADQLPAPKDPTPKPRPPAKDQGQSPTPQAQSPQAGPKGPALQDREARKRQEAERRKQQRAAEALQKRIADLEGRIAEREAKVKDLEAAMSAPGFYDDREASRHVIEQHQALMWEVGDLMAQWEALQEHAAQTES